MIEINQKVTNYLGKAPLVICSMSRHRSAYTEEDLYDYDDYDDYYDDYYDEEEDEQDYGSSDKANKATASTLTIDLGDVEKESAVQFIMETLSGSGLTKQQVMSIYEEQNGNTEATIDALLHMQTLQQEVDATPSPTTPTRRDRSNSFGKSKSMTALSPNSAAKARANAFKNMGTSGSLGSKSSEKKAGASGQAGSSSAMSKVGSDNTYSSKNEKGMAKKAAVEGLPPAVPRSGPGHTAQTKSVPSSGMTSDLSLMGFDEGELDQNSSGGDISLGPALRPAVSSPDLLSHCKDPSTPVATTGFSAIPLSRSPSSTLLTDNAVLSDEEWEVWEKEDEIAAGAERGTGQRAHDHGCCGPCGRRQVYFVGQFAI